MTTSFISVIIPTYNRGNLIDKTIFSVLNQSHNHYEIIIVDDGSTDNTELVVKSIDSKIKYFKTENRERGYARNYGLSKSSGNYVVFLDSDDLMYSHCLETASEFIEKNNKPEIFHLAYEIVDTNGKIIFSSSQLNDINKVLIKGNPLSCMNVFIRKDIAAKNLFNENRAIAGFEDWELWLRIASTHIIHHVNRISGCMLNHPYRSSNCHYDKDKLIKSVETFIESVITNVAIRNHYQKHFYLFFCSCYTYIALHLAITGKYKITAYNYLLKGLRANPLFLFENRFAAIIKHLIF